MEELEKYYDFYGIIRKSIIFHGRIRKVLILFGFTKCFKYVRMCEYVKNERIQIKVNDDYFSPQRIQL